VIATNLTGTFLTARFALPHLLSGGGAFVAVSSDAGLQGAPAYAAYCASKHGVAGLVRAMALDHGPQGVRCNAVCPGFTWTPMAERLLGDDARERSFWEGAVPLGRFGRPEEIADVIAHLSSPEAAYTNGLLYAADGGGTAGFFAGSRS
jgi:meso-butanediol dehydrogenase/(S,S)-butanediol dehydrogenase/diacetyl reductase